MKISHGFWMLSAIYMAPHMTTDTSVGFALVATVAAVIAIVVEARSKQ